MANNLIFPIGFDLQKAVEEASQNWDKTYAKRLEQAIAKRPVRIKLEFEKLEDVKKRLAELKIQPITKETRSAIRELAKELQVLAKALEQIQKFSKTTQLGQRNFTNDVQMEKLRQANERLEIQKRRVALAEQKHAEAMQRSATASRQLSSEFQNQDGYISSTFFNSFTCHTISVNDIINAATHRGVGALLSLIVSPWGVEPQSLEPESNILSIELRRHLCGKAQNKPIPIF